MKFVLLTLKSAKPAWVKEGLEDYLRKIDPLQKIEMLEVTGSTGASRENSEVKKKEDSKSLLAALKDDDYVVLFDERGQSLDSEGFAKKINQFQMSGKKRIVFIIGGAYGVNDDVKSRAQTTISFSKLVMNHWVAQIVALEQIYRGFAILKGLPYHNV
ncbi:MAG: 23S rRNA (pseudouridine(1915)-N(3))-methyltransferase RlmH [Bdellovibrionaceae bacterium]|nr:23S rRNA (pseudouridine(1915)-N(3))-methyltransferase RlmH [Pseudobdellovibrionaceae bacterium]